MVSASRDSKQARDGEERGADEYDAAWKGVIKYFVEQFFELLFPMIHEAIDWSCGAEFLEQEVQKLTRRARAKKGVVDQVIRVRRTSGEEAWVLVHVEVQGRYDVTFAQRMFRYHYHMFDRHVSDEDGPALVSVAVLADDRPRWRPMRYRHGLWGCELRLDFPSVKLLDFADRIEELEASDNPFAIIVLAHRKTQQTKGDTKARDRWRWRITRQLFEKGWDRDAILEVYRFIDWVMALPSELERLHWDRLDDELQERGMTHLTHWERKGHEKGKIEGKIEGKVEGKVEDVIQVLETRFGTVPASLVGAVSATTDLARLDVLLRQAILVESMDAFSKLLETK